MDVGTFESRFRAATSKALEFAREFVHEVLPGDVVYLVYPNQSADGNTRRGDEMVYPDDSLPEGKSHGPWTSWQVVDFLWRDERVPEWIDISVVGLEGDRTELELLCCGRFTAQDDLLYYPGRETRPFAVKSPSLPPGWVVNKKAGKFSIHWRRWRESP